MLDTGMVAERLFDRLPEAARVCLQGGLDEDEARRIAVLCGMLHDIGKLTPLFASRIVPMIPGLGGKLKDAGIPIPGRDTMPDGGQTPHALMGAAILRKHGFPHGVTAVVSAHHGKPASTIDLNKHINEEKDHVFSKHYFGRCGRDSPEACVWEEARGAWLEYALRTCGYECSQDVPELGRTQQMILSGLLITADWIASNSDHFPLMPTDAPMDTSVSNERIANGWEKIGLPLPWQTAEDMDEDTFVRRFGFAPNAVQTTLMEVTRQGYDRGGLFILEAQMGIGKTEAALAAAEVIAGRWQTGGLFFGLPTQATANGIFPRVVAWASEQGDATEKAVRLAHGLATMNQDYTALFHGRASQEECEDTLMVHPWFEGRKQALLADFVIGTVDQLLMAALRQKHVMLRHLGLCGKVVIIDECHAYDAYMTVYLRAALAWLGAYHVPVILLSATLPSEKRIELTEAYLGKTGVPGAWRESKAYPLLTWTDGDTIHCRRISSDGGGKSEVRIIRKEKGDVAELLSAQLKGGGCAAVILNTVADAQTVASVLRERMPDKEIMLVHARFTADDRAAWEGALLRRMGKYSTPADRDGLIVVGTQVMEQSLDIDADIMVTELCPMDLLLQRIGRLHRHRRQRPTLLKTACCVVLAPGSSSNAIYGQWLLQQTEWHLPNVVTLPDNIPALVQAVYATPAGDAAQDAAWLEHNDRVGKKRTEARAYVLGKPNGSATSPRRNALYGLLNSDMADDERYGNAAVRDGEPSLEVLVMVLHGDGRVGFVPWVEGGNTVSAAHIPSHEEALAIARQRLRLPQRFSYDRRIMDKTIRELEDMTRRYIPEWQAAGLLHGELFLLLDDNMEATLCGHRLQYGRTYGLMVWKEEESGQRQDI